MSKDVKITDVKKQDVKKQAVKEAKRTFDVYIIEERRIVASVKAASVDEARAVAAANFGKGKYTTDSVGGSVSIEAVEHIDGISVDGIEG